MNAESTSDAITSIRQGLEEFLTPSFRDFPSETHADLDQLRADIDKLNKDVAQLRAESAQSRQEIATGVAQLRTETTASFA